MEEIIKKLKFKGKGVILNAPNDVKKVFIKLGFNTTTDEINKISNTLIFITNKGELIDFLKNSLKQIEFDSVLWLAYPKRSSKTKTDINRDSIRAKAEEFGITTVTAISIDDTWSALRFRPIEKVGK